MRVCFVSTVLYVVNDGGGDVDAWLFVVRVESRYNINNNSRRVCARRKT